MKQKLQFSEWVPSHILHTGPPFSILKHHGSFGSHRRLPPIWMIFNHGCVVFETLLGSFQPRLRSVFHHPQWLTMDGKNNSPNWELLLLSLGLDGFSTFLIAFCWFLSCFIIPQPSDNCSSTWPCRPKLGNSWKNCCKKMAVHRSAPKTKTQPKSSSSKYMAQNLPGKNMKKHEQVNKLDPSHPFSQLHLLASAEWHLRLPSKLLMDGNRTGHLADATLRWGTVAEHGQNVADPFTTRSWDGRIIVQELILPKPEVQWQYYLWMTYPSTHSSKFLSNDVCIYIYANAHTAHTSGKIQLPYNYHPIPSVIHAQFFNVHVFFC